ncbi:unnamed protein product [Cylicocyclus nassatus]|uniref:Uncharacterized protein n=1 Tax=Cylicocyclus nassatus TaxID=53992 RepID=A0AA36DNV1_CYLNA|nr:unnamed protein product [Cylicocyclus nassatus]
MAHSNFPTYSDPLQLNTNSEVNEANEPATSIPYQTKTIPQGRFEVFYVICSSMINIGIKCMVADFLNTEKFTHYCPRHSHLMVCSSATTLMLFLCLCNILVAMAYVSWFR